MYTVFFKKRVDFLLKKEYYIYRKKKGEKNNGNLNHTRNSYCLYHHLHHKGIKRKNLKKFKKGVDKPNKISYNKYVR